MLNITEEEIVRDWGNFDINKPAVSIRCTAFNHEKYISQCLDGFLLQKTNFPFEIVVHDDASTDRTAEIIRTYEEKYPNIIKPIYEAENQYSKKDGSLRRILNANMKGRYIALCEGDDFWTSPEKLQRQYDALESHPECTIAYCRVQFADINGKPTDYIAPPVSQLKEGVVTLEKFTEVEFKGGFWCFHTSSFFIRSEVLFEFADVILNEFKNFPYTDLPTELYCLTRGNGYFVDLVQGCYRTMSGGFSNYIIKYPETDIRNQERLIMALKDFDKYTYYKYHENIEYRILRADYKKAVIEAGNKREQCKVSLRRKYRKIFGLKQRLKPLAYLICPALFEKLKNIKNGR
ncbi:MAG: glycosyltransferase family 2 protein [Porcipelethomonas sp.]